MNTTSWKRVAAEGTSASSEHDWAKAAVRLGVPSFPSDYRAWVDAHGDVFLDDFLFVLSPFASEKALNIYEQVHYFQEVIDTSIVGVEGGLRTHPSPGGLLGWATTFNGDILAWRTVGAPDQWRVVVVGSDGLDFEELHIGAMEYLRRVFEREHVCRFFPADFP